MGFFFLARSTPRRRLRLSFVWIKIPLRALFSTEKLMHKGPFGEDVGTAEGLLHLVPLAGKSW